MHLKDETLEKVIEPEYFYSDVIIESFGFYFVYNIQKIYFVKKGKSKDFINQFYFL